MIRKRQDCLTSTKTLGNPGISAISNVWVQNSHWKYCYSLGIRRECTCLYVIDSCVRVGSSTCLPQVTDERLTELLECLHHRCHRWKLAGIIGGILRIENEAGIAECFLLQVYSSHWKNVSQWFSLRICLDRLISRFRGGEIATKKGVLLQRSHEIHPVFNPVTDTITTWSGQTSAA